MFGGGDDDEFQQAGSFLWNGDTDLAEDPDLMELFQNLPDTEMSLADAMQFTDSSLSDAAARSHFVYLPEESQHGLGDVLGEGIQGDEGFAQLRGVAGYGQEAGEQEAEAASSQASLNDLFPKVDTDPGLDIPEFIHGWELVDNDAREPSGAPWRPPDPDDLGQLQTQSEDDNDSMNGDEQKVAPSPAFLGSSQRRPPPAPSPTELTRQGVSQLHLRHTGSSPRYPAPPLSVPITNRGAGMLPQGGLYSGNPGPGPPPIRNMMPAPIGVMVNANGSLEGGSFGPAARGTLGVRKGVAKNEKNALKSRRHRARKKEQERSLERRVGELEIDNQSLKEQLERVRSEKDALTKRFEEDGRRSLREVQDENAALRRDLDLVRRAMEDLLKDRAGGKVDGYRKRGSDTHDGG